jgi:hypothetical protein
MNGFTVRTMLAGMFLAGVFALSIGCGQSNPSEQAKGTGKPAETETKKDDHSGWWCGEHGIPEDECSMCSAKVAKACKAKGDWCDKHDRAKSQCFICDPSLKEKFAAKYRAKYDKEPPPVAEEEKKKNDGKK